MNTSLLLIILILLICLDKSVSGFQNNKNGKRVRFGGTTILNKEDFYGNYNKNEDYSINDDYYIDKMGTKGYMFNKTHSSDIYDCRQLRENQKKQNSEYENYDKIIHKLGIYDRQFYDKCTPAYNPSKLRSPINYNDPIKDRLRFNQGILFSTNDQIKRGL